MQRRPRKPFARQRVEVALPADRAVGCDRDERRPVRLQRIDRTVGTDGRCSGGRLRHDAPVQFARARIHGVELAVLVTHVDARAVRRECGARTAARAHVAGEGDDDAQLATVAWHEVETVERTEPFRRRSRGHEHPPAREVDRGRVRRAHGAAEEQLPRPVVDRRVDEPVAEERLGLRHLARRRQQPGKAHRFRGQLSGRAVDDDDVAEVRHAEHVALAREHRRRERVDGKARRRLPVARPGCGQVDRPLRRAIAAEREQLVAVAQVDVAFAIDDRAREDGARVDAVRRVLVGGSGPHPFARQRERVQVGVADAATRRRVHRRAVRAQGRCGEYGGTGERGPRSIGVGERDALDELAIRGTAVERRPATGRGHVLGSGGIGKTRGAGGEHGDREERAHGASIRERTAAATGLRPCRGAGLRPYGVSIRWTYWPQPIARNPGTRSTTGSSALHTRANASGQNIGTSPT